MSVSIRSPIIAVRLGMGVDRVQRGAHHQRVGLADEVGLDAGRPADQRGDRAGRRQRPARATGRSASGLVAMNRAPERDQADRVGDPLEAVGARLAEHDVVRIAVGERVAGLVQRGRQTGLADHERRAAGALIVEEARGRQRRGPDRAPREPPARWRAAARRGPGACRSSCWSGPGTGCSSSRSRAMKRRRRGSACSSRTSTPSMSISQEWVVLPGGCCCSRSCPVKRRRAARTARSSDVSGAIMAIRPGRAPPASESRARRMLYSNGSGQG